MKKAIILFIVVFIYSCANNISNENKEKVEKNGEISVIAGNDSLINIPYQLGNNLEKKLSYKVLKSASESINQCAKGACKHGYTYKPLKMEIVDINDTLLVSMDFVAKNSFGVEDKFDKNEYYIIKNDSVIMVFK